MLRWIAWLLGVPLSLALLLLFAGASWNALADWRDARRLHPPGRLVDVGGGDRLHLHCTGEPGARPTVVLDTGWAMPALGWALVQPELSKRGRVCSYDRRGMGWSDPAPSTAPRTAGAIAEQLRTLLRVGGESGPFVLVGHSNGGMSIRLFAARHPGEVAGLVFVDGSTEDMDEKFLGHEPEPEPIDTRSAWRREPLLRLALWAGVLRFQARRSAPEELLRKLSPETVDEGIYLLNRPTWYPAAVAELDGMPASFDEMRAAGGLGHLPLVVLTSSKFVPNGRFTPEEQLRMRRAWVEEIQPPLARLSTRGRHVLVDSGHQIPFEAPEAVVKAVDDLVAMTEAK